MPRKVMPPTPNQKPKAVLPEPSFKYGSNTHLLLTYAKSINKDFTIENVRSFTARYSNNHEVNRSIEVLLKNGSIKKTGENQWKITTVGIHQVFDFARRRSSI